LGHRHLRRAGLSCNHLCARSRAARALRGGRGGRRQQLAHQQVGLGAALAAEQQHLRQLRLEPELAQWEALGADKDRRHGDAKVATQLLRAQRRGHEHHLERGARAREVLGEQQEQVVVDGAFVHLVQHDVRHIVEQLWLRDQLAHQPPARHVQ
jgi:hypothetical protein